MILEEIQQFIDHIDNGEVDKEGVLMLTNALCDIIKTQNKIILELRNNYIRLENSMTLFEKNIEQNEAYKKLCNLILNKIDTNPITALWFLYSVKKKIAQYYNMK